MAVNPDLIERAEATPDTVVTMVDGHKMVVAESVAEVVDRVRGWRASVAAEAFHLSSTEPCARADQGADHGPVAANGDCSALARVLRMPAREE